VGTEHDTRLKAEPAWNEELPARKQRDVHEVRYVWVDAKHPRRLLVTGGATAQMHLRGEGVGRSKVLAHAWLNLAARDRGEEGRAARNEMDALETSMETEEIEKAQRIAADYAVKGR